ncbi:hypothetical protein [Stenotrophomonas rhizophila]|uniref:hypothetical protein n=1 Tax=Stenotrophomonas rhizophila TaxID=216778 RepID=UPI0028AC8987|nr:hypothetical protein [Stenotrophomonas rhizophila]
MAFEFCLPAIGVGGLANWASVAVGLWAALIAAVATVVGIAGAAATVWVALLAHRTSQRATEIADRAAQIAQQQHQEARDLSASTARIVGRLLLHEISGLPTTLRSQHRKLQRVSNDWTAGKASPGQLIDTLDEVSAPLMPNADSVQERIHTLPDKLGADVAAMISHCRGIAAEAASLRGRITELPAAAGIGVRTFSLPPDMGQIVRLAAHVDFVASLAPTLATEFRHFVFLDGAGEDGFTVVPDGS